MNLERDLLGKIAALPAREKVPMSRFARELNCSTSVVISGVAALVMSGKLVEATMRPPVDAMSAKAREGGRELVEGGNVYSEVVPFLVSSGLTPTEFGTKALNDPGAVFRWKRGAGVRPSTLERVRAFIAGYVPPVVVAVEAPALPDPAKGLPSGADLSREIDRYCRDVGITRSAFAKLAGLSGIQIAQMASRDIRAVTVAKVRAVIASGGKSARALGFQGVRPGVRQHESKITLEEIERRRRAHAGAAEARLPGESVADAVAREASEQSERRNNARLSKGVRQIETSRERFARLAREVEAEENEAAVIERTALQERELDELVSPSSVLRRAQRDWPDQCERVKAIAAELGVSLGEAWRRVIGAGVDCLSECEA